MLHQESFDMIMECFSKVITKSHANRPDDQRRVIDDDTQFSAINPADVKDPINVSTKGKEKKDKGKRKKRRMET